MLCNKCKVNQPFEDDSWCLACSAWESIGVDLVARWDVPGLRDLAGEAVIATARQLKGLRRLSAGLAAKAVSEGASSGTRDRHHRGAVEELKKGGEAKKSETKEREPLPRSRSTPAIQPEVKAEKAASSEYEHSEEEDEEEEVSEECPGAKRLAFAPGDKGEPLRPAEPAGPPPGHTWSDRGQGHHRERDHHSSSHRGEGERAKHKKRKRHRAGKKHKNLQRLVEDPHARVHRSLDSSFWGK